MNQVFRDLFAARVAGAVASAKALGQMNHAGLKGALREVLVRALLRPFLPPTIGVGHGVVITAYDEQSTEQDVVIYSRNAMPCLLVDEDAGVFPLESTLFTMEVKSTLTLEELRETHEKARRLEKLLHVPGGSPEHVIPCLFAFKSDLSQKDEIERYQGLIEAAEPAIRAICVVGRGYWYWTKVGGWQSIVPTASYSEVAGLIDGVVSVYERVLQSRARPLLQQYVGAA